MNKEFYRVSKLPAYVFAEINSLRDNAIAEGREIIDFGMGSPDSPPPTNVIKKMIEATSNPKLHGYSKTQGIKVLREALAIYYQKRFGVTLDSDKEVIATIGSKEGIASLVSAVCGPNTTVVVPAPCYPIHYYAFVFSESKILRIPSDPNLLIKEFKNTVEKSSDKISFIVVNYPCNPTADTVSIDFYQELVDFCLKKNIYIISDLAYSEIYFDKPSRSILEVENAKKIAIEFSTLSKSFSMAGWRMGFAAGNPELIAALSKMKSYLDYGSFTPIQMAATEALTGSWQYVSDMRDLYKRRRDFMVSELHKIGWNVKIPNASMFIWAEIPEKFKHMGSMEFCKFLVKEANIIVSPGIGFGTEGDGFVRISLIEDEARMRKAIDNMNKALKLI